MTQRRDKTAGVLIYLIEELGDARLRCEQLKRYVDQAMRLVSQSEQKAHIHEVAGDLVYGIPDTLFRLDKALDATALAASRLDYEELKQELRPEKVNELEQVLKDVRIRHFDRRAPEGNTMRKLATGTDVANALRRVASAIEADEQRGVSPSTAKISNTLISIVAELNGGPTLADQALRARFEQGEPADPTENMSDEDAKKWRVEHLKNKDNFTKEAASGDPRWIIAKWPGKDKEGKEFKKGDMVLYYPNSKTILSGEKAKAEWKKFESAVQDEAVYNGHYASEKKGSDEKESRFEEGKPADPTENMSKEDASKWKEEHDKNKDNFKAAEVTARFEAGKPADPTQNMSEEDAAQWKAMNEEHGDKFKSASDWMADDVKTAAADAKVSTFLTILGSYLVQQDQKEGKRNPNIYRLGLFLEAKEKVEADVRRYLNDDSDEAMKALKASLQHNFTSNFPPLKKIVKQIDEWVTAKKLPKLGKV